MPPPGAWGCGSASAGSGCPPTTGTSPASATTRASSLTPRARIEFQPTRAFFLRAIAELRNDFEDALRAADTGAPLLIDGVPTAAGEFNSARVDLLASYEPTPGTVAYLGYGASLGAPPPFAIDRLERESDGLFFKVAYRFRW